MDKKTCKTCWRSLPLGKYRKNKQSKDGLEYSCRECMKIEDKVYRTIHREAIEANHKKHRDAHREERRAASYIYYHTHRGAKNENV